jgi:hypothetical protein
VVGDDSFQLVATDMGLIYCRPSISFAIAARWDEVTLVRPHGEDPVVLPINWPTHGELKFTVSKRLAGNVFRRWLQLRMQTERQARREKAERFNLRPTGPTATSSRSGPGDTITDPSGEWELVTEVEPAHREPAEPIMQAMPDRRDRGGAARRRRQNNEGKAKRRLRREGATVSMPPGLEGVERRIASSRSRVEEAGVPKPVRRRASTAAPPMPPAAPARPATEAPPTVAAQSATGLEPRELGSRIGAEVTTHIPEKLARSIKRDVSTADEADRGTDSTAEAVDPDGHDAPDPLVADQGVSAPEPVVAERGVADLEPVVAERGATGPGSVVEGVDPNVDAGPEVGGDANRHGSAVEARVAAIETVHAPPPGSGFEAPGPTFRGAVDDATGRMETHHAHKVEEAEEVEEVEAAEQTEVAKETEVAEAAEGPGPVEQSESGSEFGSEVEVPDPEPPVESPLAEVTDTVALPDGDWSMADGPQPIRMPTPEPPVALDEPPLTTPPSWIGSPVSIVGAMVVISTFVLITAVTISSYRRGAESAQGSIDGTGTGMAASDTAGAAAPRPTIDHQRFNPAAQPNLTVEPAGGPLAPQATVGSEAVPSSDTTVAGSTDAVSVPPQDGGPTEATELQGAPRLCNSNYSGCIPDVSDVDCPGDGDGPLFATEPAVVMGQDVYELDTDGDGEACEADQPPHSESVGG